MDETVKKTLTRASEGYASNTVLRAAVQAIPYIGGPLDTLLAGKGSSIRLQRLEAFVSDLTMKLDRAESVQPVDEQDLFDLMIEAMEKATRTRLAEKRALYANVVAKHVAEGRKLDETEMALRIVETLDLIHLEILREALQAPVCGEPFEGHKVIAINEGGSLPNATPVVLTSRLRNWPLEALRYAASELVARGLLYDEGIGRWDSKAMEYLVATDTAHWVNKWLT